jgi:hypothetical protein
VRGRRGPRLGGLAVLLVLGMAGCATAPARLPPVLGGVPADQVDALVRRWADEWASFRGLRAAVDLTVVRDGRAQRTAGALLLSPTHLRFEAITPIGLPALVLTVAPDRLLVYSPTEGKAWTARPTAEAMGRWLGTPVEPAALIRLLTGHVPPPADGTPVRVGQDRGPHVVLQREAGIERVWVTTEGRPCRAQELDPPSLSSVRACERLPAGQGQRGGFHDQVGGEGVRGMVHIQSGPDRRESVPASAVDRAATPDATPQAACRRPPVLDSRLSVGPSMARVPPHRSAGNRARLASQRVDSLLALAVSTTPGRRAPAHRG